ncbi:MULTISPECIES: S16 family serine protease [unclassified Motilimonas]|uniref:S16 family serine protease n=1 Tax=Motilimonas TaxID=1914248 RepID=UPI001E35D975|nr:MULTISPECIES: S16 family serine protease [unclassified Motilimonas]MCE0556881.1 AAA family ATPase [Motilimonas sp. E26]MDO6527910.1 AAA family ATPase [Motilimonas sp. 1_MG-2023]
MPKLNPLSLDLLQPDFTSLITHKSRNEASDWTALFPFAQRELTDFQLLPNKLLTFCISDWNTAKEYICQILPQSSAQQLATHFAIFDHCEQAGVIIHDQPVTAADFQQLDPATQTLLTERFGALKQGKLRPLPEQRLAFLNAFNEADLFGEIYLNSAQQLILSPGALLTQRNGYLVLNVPPLLENPILWYQVKSYLLTGQQHWQNARGADKLRGVKLPDSSALNCKIIITGSRSQLAELSQLDPEFAGLNQQFAEVADEVKITDNNIGLVRDFINLQAMHNQLAPPDDVALNALLQHLSARREHRHYIQFNVSYLSKLFNRCRLINAHFSPAVLSEYIAQQKNAMILPQSYSDESIVEQQIPIQLQGHAVGQINGLSVVELDGHPIEFGEVFRVTAAEFLGDGEVIDVERKAEMAGNIHSKAMMIVESYLSQVFGKEEHVPFSANIVFEQSYSHTDGDSAAVATYVALMSALSQQPARQDLAMTGAMDQAGNVMAVGGINEKIAAICRTAQLKQLNSPVTVLIPASNLINLSLDHDVLEAVKGKRLTIYAISHVDQAISIAISDVDTVYDAIRHRIKELGGRDDDEDTWLAKCLQFFR